ncbi:BMC domain-containing protein [Sporolactobacillus shoreicorticis]|uniref:BMC domain-containing protein n=1 Tax=Sporolactobacillus shoreicorticis TaxID=1923877 RepID=A0ABW5S425_9BACL|nr:BMC domain-containing protein [Sporolactobacillus shoreicorticis]MCO7124437.1 BMC domain-containing protein [Sporolactobacillus shoreicorticis]
MPDALGMLEVRGYVAAITFADVMAKVADVTILELKKTRGMGWMTIFIEGDVAAVQAAIQAASTQSREENLYVTAKVIPRPATDLKEKLVHSPLAKDQEKSDDKEKQPPVKTSAPPKEAQSESEEALKEPEKPKNTGTAKTETKPASRRGGRRTKKAEPGKNSDDKPDKPKE